MRNAAINDNIPNSHTNYLSKMADELGFQPKVCYDIGACVMHWTKAAKTVWPQSEYVLFDAYEPAAFLWQEAGHKHFAGVLSDVDHGIVKFFQNHKSLGGNSYYKENNAHLYPDDAWVEKPTRTLDSVVQELNLPLPDVVKIDVQGCEIDILKGAQKTLAHAKYLIVELQEVDYNLGAPKVDFSIPFIEAMKSGKWLCIAKKFSDNGPDADYCFKNLDRF